MTGLQSILIGTSPLSLALAAAIVLAIVRPPRGLDRGDGDRLLRLFLAGVALQCLHFIEEYLTGMHLRWPELLGLPAWTPEFFVSFNVAWIAVWVLSAIALRSGGRLERVALAAVWFFALGMTLNGVAHPALSLRAGGYFPGLLTSPLVGLAGVGLLARLLRTTGPRTAPLDRS